MDKCLSRHLAATVARAAVARCPPGASRGRPLQGGGAAHGAKVDSAIRDWHDRGEGKDRQRVIIRVKRGQRSAVDRALKAGGLDVKAHHSLIDAITVEIPRSALRGLRHNPNVETISLDAQTTSFQTVAPTGQTVRSTLGVPSRSAKGTGVGVAVVDSGIAASSVFGSRIAAFYDFTTGAAVAAPPSDRVRSRHARGGSHRRLRRAIWRGLSRDCHQRDADRPQGARRGRVGLHEPRHCRTGVCGHQEAGPRDRRHQPLARAPGVRAGSDRPAGPGSRGGRARRHRGRGFGRELREESRPPARSAMPASRRRATRRRPSPSARSTPRAPERRWTTASRRTALAGPRGTTARPSPTSSRPDTR